jgi:hypothetical protein
MSAISFEFPDDADLYRAVVQSAARLSPSTSHCRLSESGFGCSIIANLRLRSTFRICAAKNRVHHHPAKLLVASGQLTLAQLIARTETIGEQPRCRLHQRLLPRVDLVGMDPEQSSKLGTVAAWRSAVRTTLALKEGSCLRLRAYISCLSARHEADIYLCDRMYLSQLSKFWGPPRTPFIW